MLFGPGLAGAVTSASPCAAPHLHARSLQQHAGCRPRRDVAGSWDRRAPGEGGDRAVDQDLELHASVSASSTPSRTSRSEPGAAPFP